MTTTYSPQQIIALVLKYHPNAASAWLFNSLAICLAESDGFTGAISPAHDYGLWQINRIHFGDGIINASNWTVDSVQVAEMWRLSNGMRNWAAWCTAWRNPGPNCGHGNLPNIEPGSAASAYTDIANNALRGRGVIPPAGPAPPGLTPEQQDEKAVSAAFGYMRNYYTRFAHAQFVAINNAITKIERLRP